MSRTSAQGPGDELGARETKQCPDCAETVLAAARKCRFCGYRFDAPRSGSASLLERLGLFKRQRPLEFGELLAEWGIELADGEATACFRYVVFDEQKGYLLVTDRRVVFVADHRRSQATVVEYRQASVDAVRAGRGGHQLTLVANGTEHAIVVGTAASPDTVRGALEALAQSG